MPVKSLKKSTQSKPLTPAVTEQEMTLTDKQGNTKGVFHNEQGKEIHTAWTFNKKKRVLTIHPYSYRRINHTMSFPKTIRQVQLKGWKAYGDLPLTLRRAKKGPGLTKQLKDIAKFFYQEDKQFQQLNIDVALNRSKRTPKAITLAFADFKDIMVGLKKIKDRTGVQRKNYLVSCCSSMFNRYPAAPRKLPPGSLAEFLKLYDSFDNLSQQDIDGVSKLISGSSSSTIISSSFSLQTKDRLNIVFLEDIIQRFEKLIKKSVVKEAEWQEFFTNYTWVLNYIFPYQVILYDEQAYVGGKTLRNEEGRVVDYLLQNNLTDNFALVEIKLHTTPLINQTLYRKPSIYAINTELSGAMNQVLDQKDMLMKNYGKEYKIFNPKALLIAGSLRDLDQMQLSCFENFRFNLKHLDIVTFDEVLAKLKGLHNVLTQK